MQRVELFYSLVNWAYKMNSNVEIHKLDIGIEHLHNALRLYYEGGAYFSSLHLAGAAEEILGYYVSKVANHSNSFIKERDQINEISKILCKNKITLSQPKFNKIAEALNYVKNQIKHIGEPIAETVDFNPKEEAKIILQRAIDDYYCLMNYYPLEETELIQR